MSDSEGPSVLDFLPASMRTRLTMERLALMRTIAELQRDRDELLKRLEAVCSLISDKHARLETRAFLKHRSAADQGGTEEAGQ